MSAARARSDRSDGGVPTLSSLSVSNIRPYEHDPRRAPNVEYSRIKASIRCSGLDQPLVVTKRPGDPEFVIHSGGNTRLRILQELLAETNDPRFEYVPCVIREWTLEADVLIGHLKENELRGSLRFLDKALAVVEIRRLMEEATPFKSVTQTQLAEFAERNGYSVSQGSISQMFYAVERLLPVLTRVLESGVGRPQISKIAALDRGARTVWLDVGADSEAEYDDAFCSLCRRYDSPDWDINLLRRGLEAEIADRSSLSIHAVSLQLDARLAGRAIEIANPTADEQASVELSAEEKSRTKAASRCATPDPAGSSTQNESAETVAHAALTAPAVTTETQTSECSERGNGSASKLTHTAPALTDPKSLRGRLWTLASRLANRNGLGDLVVPTPGAGAGFVLRDAPDPALDEQLDQDTLAKTVLVWWHLAACAELTVAPPEVLLPNLSEGALLTRALAEQDADVLFGSVRTPDPGQAGYRLWRSLDDRDWDDFLGLMETYRALHRSVMAEGRDLWGAQYE